MDPKRLARLLDRRPAGRVGTGTVPAAVRPTMGPAAAGEPQGVPVPPAATGAARAGGRRRPAVLVASALLAAAGLGLVTAGPLSAQAAPMSEPAGATSVAEELGLRGAPASPVSADEAGARLHEIAASRAEREDAQAAAAQAQAAADEAARQAAAAAAQAAAEAARPHVALPVAGARLSSGFGSRWGTLHAGQDFAAPIGTPEYAVMDGVVVRAGAASGFGLAVYLQHGDGTVTVYGHMEKILVAQGQAVRAGDPIALLGNMGESTGPHLHFEVHPGGMQAPAVDPLPWLREHGVAV
jgi:murein DD-endopeptidase MepM/ murein hydrolase activator NlpD